MDPVKNPNVCLGKHVGEEREGMAFYSVSPVFMRYRAYGQAVEPEFISSGTNLSTIEGFDVLV